MRTLRVLSTRLPILVQDEGRPGHALIGVGSSGAADLGSYRLGARLLGHSHGEAALEITLGQAELRFEDAATFVLTGAPAPADVDGTPVPAASLISVRAGQRLRLGSPATGLRTYLSVHGGIDVPAVLGSRSTDTLSGIGPDPLTGGGTVGLGPPNLFWTPLLDQVPLAGAAPGPLLLTCTPGPREDWFADPAVLTTRVWTVSPDTDRVAARLDGDPLVRRTGHRDRELPSEGMVRGSVQVPADGRPVVFLADHPVTGGYPVIAVLTPGSCDRLVQARPGQQVRLGAEGYAQLRKPRPLVRKGGE